MASGIPAGTLEKFSTFGDLLRFLRRRAGMTQIELSIAVGYSDAQISRLEQNLRLPDLPTIGARFVSALGLEEETEVVERLMDLASSVRREDAPALGLCPYKGLNYFDETDADLFAGREALTARLTGRILSMTTSGDEPGIRFLAVVGASGSGKSSLVRAGLVPALRWNPAAANWLIHIITPSSHPLESLAASLTRESRSVSEMAMLMDDLARDQRSLSLHVKQVLNLRGSRRLLLIVDQFEELFTLCRSEQDRAAFINNLLTAASEEDGPVAVLIAMRADFYAACSGYPGLREALASQQEYIGAMNDDELCRAIEEPARRGRWEFEPELVDLLLHDVGREPGALPLLSHALLETWQRRCGRTMTINGYAASGGVRGAIAETAEAVFADQFTPDQQNIARRVFLRLTELGDETSSGDTRRRATFEELILQPEEEASTRLVIEHLADARLVTTSENSVEVAHEALIREWPKLRGWLEDNREGLRLHRHLTDSAMEWTAAGREPDILYRGARLAQAREWAAANSADMNVLEREFLETSQTWAEHEAAEREELRQRELETARRLAEAEKQRAEEQAMSASQLKKRALHLAGALGIALVMAIVALFFGAQARQAAIRALKQQRVATARELAAAAVSNLEADPERSILLAMQAVDTTYAVDRTWTAEAEDALHRSLQVSRIERTLKSHTGRVWAVAFSPACQDQAGTQGIACGATLATESDDGAVKIWNSDTGQELLTISTGDTHGYTSVAFSPEGARLITAGSIGTAGVWNAATGQLELTLVGHSNWVTGVAFSPDGTRIATASEDRTVKIWDAGTGQNLLTLRGHTEEVWNVAFNPDGNRLASASSDGKAKIWDTATGREIFTLQSPLPVVRVRFSPDGRLIATGGFDNTARLWEAATGKPLLTLRGHTGGVISLAFSPDGARLATASVDGKAIVWDTTTGQEMFTLRGHTDQVVDVAFSPDCNREAGARVEQCGTRLATASWDGTAKLWNASFSSELFTLFSPRASSETASPDGSRLAVGFEDGRVKILDIPASVSQASENVQNVGMTITEEEILPGHKDAVKGIAFSRDGTRLATSGEDRTAKIWDLASGQEVLNLAGHTEVVMAVVFSPDGGRLATLSLDFSIKVWNLGARSEADRELFTLRFPTWSSALTFSPDGSRLAAGINDGTSKVWDASTGKELLSIHIHTGEVWGIAFSPDGSRLATASEDKTAIIWDAETGQELFRLARHTGPVNSIVYSPDGSRLATASQDGTVRVWDAANGQELLTLSGYTEPVASVAFSQDGTRLYSASYTGMLRAYVLPLEGLMALGRARVTRSMTSAECQQYLHLAPDQCPQGSNLDQEPSPELTGTANALSVTGGKRVCQVTDEAGVHDEYLNQITNAGVQQAAEQFGWQNAVLESQLPSDYQKNIATFLQSGCDLIITTVPLSDVIKSTAEANPAQKFQLLEWFYDPPLSNVRTDMFAVDQAAFLTGYIAASATKTGVIATFGGIDILPVRDFMNGYALGAAYFNEQNGTQIKVLGWDVEKQAGLFAGSFIDTNAGHAMAETLMGQGADIILPVAGNVGLGAAAAALEKGGVYIIGVDSDWTKTYPEYADIILTSIQKRLDVSVVSAVRSIEEGTFTGGIQIGTLANGGVSITPFYHLDGLVSPEIKADLEEIKKDIIAGKIKTLP